MSTGHNLVKQKSKTKNERHSLNVFVHNTGQGYLNMGKWRGLRGGRTKAELQTKTMALGT